MSTTAPPAPPTPPRADPGRLAEQSAAADTLGALAPLAGEVAATMARIASDVALVIDGDGVIRSVAEAAEPGGREALLAGQGWVGRRWVDTVSAESRAKLETLLAEARQGGVTRRREVNHPLAGGDAVPVAWTAIRLGDTGPVVAVGRDLRAVAAIQRRFMDAQHDMERDYWQRRQAENRYRLMFQVASDAVLVLDAATHDVLEANGVAQGWLADGRAPLAPAAPTSMAAFGDTQSLVGRPFLALLPLAARAAVQELLATARSSGRAAEIRVRLGAAPPAPASDISATPFSVGPRLHLLVRARRDVALAAGVGGDGGFAGTAARGGVGAADAAAGAVGFGGTPLPSMAAFVESTPDGVVVCDAAGRIVSANPAFAALVQCASETLLLGRELGAVADGADAGDSVDSFEAAGSADVAGSAGSAGAAGAAPGAASTIAQAWRSLMARARRTGLVPRSALTLRHGLITLAVEASAALLAEGDQEHIGFIVRSSEPAGAAPLPGFSEAAHTLAELAAQVGHLPLAELMREAAHVAERQFVETALVRSGGLLAAAAAMLGLAPEALALRMKRLNLAPPAGSETPLSALN